MAYDVNRLRFKNKYGIVFQVRLVWDADGGGKSDWLPVLPSEFKTYSVQAFNPLPREGTHFWLQGTAEGTKDKSGESKDMRLSFDKNDWKAEFEGLRRNNFKFQLSFRSFDDD